MNQLQELLFSGLFAYYSHVKNMQMDETEIKQFLDILGLF